MSVLTVIKKIGDKIISVVEWPLKHSVMLGEYLANSIKDYPKTRTAFVGLVQRIEALGPDVLAAIAAKGLNIPEDIKCEQELMALFGYIKDEVLPVVEADYADFEAAKSTDQASADPAPATTAAAELATSPGLHAVTPA